MVLTNGSLFPTWGDILHFNHHLYPYSILTFDFRTNISRKFQNTTRNEHKISNKSKNNIDIQDYYFYNKNNNPKG